MAKSSDVAMQSKARAKDTLAFINGLVDENSFIETDALIVSSTPLGEAVGEGVVSGFGSINGIQTAIFATDPNVLKGSIGVGAAEKISRTVQSAVKTGIPLISVIDTSGARFGEGVRVLEGYGKILDVCAEAYGSIPTVCILKGNNFGMLSYLTAFSDLTIALDKAVMATSSPLILASKTKTDVSKVGTASLHETQSGAVTVTVKSAAELKKTLSAYLELISETVSEPSDDLNRNCKGLRSGIKVSAIIKEIADRDSFFELRAGYAPEVVTGLARLGGVTVGIVANNGAIEEGRITAKSAAKTNELLALCQTYGIPVVNIVDCAGVISDLDEENSGLIKEVGTLIYNYSQISVGKIALVVGKAIGVGYTALASDALYDYTVAWETSETGVLNSQAAADLLYGEEIAKAKDKSKAEQKLADTYAKENMAASKIASEGLYDNVIKPEFSRRFLVGIVQTFLSKR